MARPVNESLRKWTPPAWAWKYVSACLDPAVKPTKTARCAEIGISRVALWKQERREEFVTWIAEQIQAKLGMDRAEVRTSLVRACIFGQGEQQLEAIRLYFELFGTGAQRPPIVVEDGKDDLEYLNEREISDITSILSAASRRRLVTGEQRT